MNFRNQFEAFSISYTRTKTHVLEFLHSPSRVRKMRQTLAVSKLLRIWGCSINYSLNINLYDLGVSWLIWKCSNDILIINLFQILPKMCQCMKAPNWLRHVVKLALVQARYKNWIGVGICSVQAGKYRFKTWSNQL